MGLDASQPRSGPTRRRRARSPTRAPPAARGSRTPRELKADTSGAIVLNAVSQRHPWLFGASAPRQVTCNHFDADGLVAVFAATQPAAAAAHDRLLRAVAHMGDFRQLSADSLSADSPLSASALAVNLWVNAVERTRFYRPFHGSEEDGAAAKYDYFLPRLRGALEAATAGATAAAESQPAGGRSRGLDAAAFAAACSAAGLSADCEPEFEAEVRQVADGLSAVSAATARPPAPQPKPPCTPPAAPASRFFQSPPHSSRPTPPPHPSQVALHPALGLAVVTLPSPVHYYALFGAAPSADCVLSVYPGPSYELEYRYTGYVELASRPAALRLELGPLLKALNARERAPHCAWAACRRARGGGPRHGL